MANVDIVPNLKASTVAIGIIDESNPMFPLAIGGTGFFISEDGFFVTASHVLDDLDYLLKDRFKDNLNARIMIKIGRAHV